MKDEIIKVSLKEKSYKVFIRNKILNDCGLYLEPLNLSKKILLVSQNKVPKSYRDQTEKSLKKSGYKVFKIILQSGETYKNKESLLKIIKSAVKNKFERNDSFLALGGGVISDLTGFAASIYYRGVNFICLPTTLLGMVDASIGGKTSINIKEGKNLLGTFYQPRVILIDPYCIKTLPAKELLTGMGEVIKYALLERTARKIFSGQSFFNYLRKNKNNILKKSLTEILKIITHSAKIKAKIVSKDEKESNLRAILNLGHTFAHGIEQAYNYKKYTHGEAVSIGMCLASKLAYNHGFIKKHLADLVIELIDSYKLPTETENEKTESIIKSMLLDKKVKDGKLRFILPYQNIGTVKIISTIPITE